MEWGCGHGENLRYVVEKYGFSSAIGLDVIFDEPIRVSENPEISLMSSNLNETLAIDDSSVDVLIAMMVIEHLFDPFHSFSEISRLLADDGVAIINLPLVTSVKNRVRLLAGRLPVTSVPEGRWFDDKSWDGNHLHYFSVDSIKRLCAVSRLAIVAISGVGNFSRLKNTFPSLLAGELTFAVQKVGV